jgi:hypothetical protein
MSLRSVLRQAREKAPASFPAWIAAVDHYSYQGLVSHRSLHSSNASGNVGRRNPRKEVEKGKEQQAKIAKLMQKIIPEVPKKPKRTPEELADAAARAKEYSRQCMRTIRDMQNRQRERTKLRYYTTVCHYSLLASQSDQSLQHSCWFS